jgi:glycosyltransferase involved in cell wall biosynthesis
VTRVTAFTAGFDAPGSRFRIRQFIEPLAQLDVAVVERWGLGAYPPAHVWMWPLWLPGALAARFPGVIASHGGDVTLFQRELLSTVATLECLTRRPRVLDVDDAIWLNRGGRSARRLANWCDLIICGNSYLAENFSRWNSRIALQPTAVDTDRYTPGASAGDSAPVIGWIGTSSNLPYLEAIEPALSAVLEARPTATVLVVSDREPRLQTLRPGRWRFNRWSSKREVADIQSMTVGLMPLANTPWAHGKCSFKMLTYMACAVPVVVSPVGMNADVLAEGEMGVAAVTTAEWVDALCDLLDSAEVRRAMGREGRRVAEESFSVRVLAPRLAALLKGVARP